LSALCLSALCALGLGCSAIYPELTTPIRPLPPGKPADPPPPDDLFFVGFEGAVVPQKTPDGRNWDDTGGSAPDPFAKFFVEGREVMRTPVQSNTFEPTWPNQKRGNRRVPPGAVVRIELWDSNPINNHPVCVKDLKNFGSNAETGGVSLRCDSGASVDLIVQPARAKLGLGMYYELRRVEVFVTRVLDESPAARAGLTRGAQILEIQGEVVEEMREGQARSLINTHARTGLSLKVKHANGKVDELELKEGAIYPTEDAEALTE
jgi:hypothetical protein